MFTQAFPVACLFAAAAPCLACPHITRTKASLVRVGKLLTCLLILPGCQAAPAAQAHPLAATPPMGWNDWAHYQCDYTAQTILDNARELVKTGLGARGYNTVTIDDCWMQKTRDSHGNLQPDPARFPHGMRPVAQAIHALGLKFGIYEDAGYATCGGFSGSGEPQGGGDAHFLQDAKLFASWGVDYLKLDGCNVYAAKGQSQNAAYRKAYRAESHALRRAGRPIVFSESAPAYFQGTPGWYDVLTWVRDYGQLWREGSDIATFDKKHPNRPRFHSVLWNYSCNLPLGRFQKPGNWNDADFIIGGDSGMTLAEARSQLALWSMMSAPLILSDNLSHLSPAAIAILGNKAVLAVDQDPLGKMATLLRRSPASDLLLKPLDNGDYAVAVLNRSASPLPVTLHASDFGFTAPSCSFSARNLWSGDAQPRTSSLHAVVASHDTALWRIHPAASCGAPTRSGVIVRIVPNAHRNSESYTRCLTAPGSVEACNAAATQTWTVTADGALQSDGKCLTAIAGKAGLSACRATAAQRWRYTLAGNLVNRRNHLCLTGSNTGTLSVAACGHNLASQIWSIPNAVARSH
ncbi:MAG: ricin-type beta-trefoil lectin domain protein [Acidobacteriaceae bacterium]